MLPAPFPLESEVDIDNDYEGEFYVRVSCSDRLGIVKSVGEAAEGAGVSIHAILQNSIESHANIDFVVTTETCKLSQVSAFTKAIEGLDFALSSPVLMPLLK